MDSTMSAASVASKLKIVAFGSVNGDLAQLTQKMASIHKSKAGPFDLFLISGGLFVPVPTYFVAGSAPLPAVLANKVGRGGDVCENLTYLGKSGILKTACGAKLAYLSGSGPASGNGIEPEAYTEHDAQPLLEESVGKDVDILLTHDWPDAVHHLSGKWKLQLDSKIPSPSSLVSKIVAKLQPKYHFAAPSQGIFFEREPYRTASNPDETENESIRYNVTRFISLGSVGSKQRWAYAMHLAQGVLPVPENELPPKTTPTPFRTQKKPVAAAPQAVSQVATSSPPSPLPSQDTFYQQSEDRFMKRVHQDGPNREMSRPRSRVPPGYVCKACQGNDHLIRECPERGIKKERAALDPKTCWFCLANPKVAKHLIVALGNTIYLSIAKGPLVDPFGPSCLVPGGGNLILVSILHLTSFLTAAPGTCAAFNEEITICKKAITSMYSEFGAAPVFYEAYRPGGQHAHLQIAAVPLSLVPQLEDAFKAEGNAIGLSLSSETSADPNTSYFQVHLPDNTSLTGIIAKGVRFNLGFGREVLGKLLGTPERIDWRQINYSVEEEQTMQKTFSQAFNTFSPFNDTQ